MISHKVIPLAFVFIICLGFPPQGHWPLANLSGCMISDGPRMNGSLAWPSKVVRGNMSLEVRGLGQLVAETPGTKHARGGTRNSLKATVQIAEEQKNKVSLGQKAVVDTRTGLFQGHVSRIADIVSNGAIGVDISFDEQTPAGAQAGESVTGIIRVEDLLNVLYIGRPIHGEPNSLCKLFKVSSDGSSATLVEVKLGKAAVNTIEVLGGLNEGDVVILSDMSQFDSIQGGTIAFSPHVKTK